MLRSVLFREGGQRSVDSNQSWIEARHHLFFYVIILTYKRVLIMDLTKLLIAWGWHKVEAAAAAWRGNWCRPHDEIQPSEQIFGVILPFVDCQSEQLFTNLWGQMEERWRHDTLFKKKNLTCRTFVDEDWENSQPVVVKAFSLWLFDIVLAEK